MMSRVHTPYGDIFPTVGSCRDDYPNMSPFHNAAGQLMRLQDPARRAFLAAELQNGRRLPWRKHRKPKAIRVTGSDRTCALQTQLHNEDPQRFADPDTSRHPRGLAIDVDTGNLTRRVVRVLEAAGWHRARPDDEPWHFSYFETA